MPLGAGTKNRIAAPYVLAISEPYSSEFDDSTNHVNDVVHPRHASNEAIEVAMLAGDDAEKRWRFSSSLFGGVTDKNARKVVRS
jgi:hypothetical protein